ncbi:MAG: aspartate kinase [Vicingaceae bacterium]
MLIMKFGGTSVGSPARIKEVGKLIANDQKKIVVLSAMSGATNDLLEIAKDLYVKNHLEANRKIDQLEMGYKKVVSELYDSKQFKEKAMEMVELHFNRLRAYTQDLFTIYEERAVLALGELISTALLHYHLLEKGIDNALLPALNFMRIDKEGEPDEYYIRQNLEREMGTEKNSQLYITQGFICRNAYGEIDNLKRGGSDYTASIIGAILDASEIQIWTDIDGFHNNDPRIVTETSAIARLSFEEAAELAYFGAKILHPSSVRPAREKNIPVRLKNTLNPKAQGTLLTSEETGYGIKAIAAKDGITAIKIKSGRMLLAYGFMRKVFEIFETYKTSIDLITTSEVTVSLTIEDTTHLDEIVADLSKYGSVELDSDQTIICVVGNFISDSTGYALKIFDSLKEIPIRMISYGGSRHNISILVDSTYKTEALKSMHQSLFET